jgi:hypothetical protein
MIITLTRGYVTEIDDETFTKLFTYWMPDGSQLTFRISELKWSVFTPYHTQYARAGVGSSRRNERRWILMHRLLTEAPPDLIADHEDRNGLNNKLNNLRLVTCRESRLNTRKKKAKNTYRGVYWNRKDKRWSCRITNAGKTLWVGNFVDEVAAAKAYDIKAIELHGAFAMLNFPI